VKYVLDVNILLSSLIKDSVTRRIIFESGLDFYFPEISYIKIIEYKDYIMKKASLNDKEFFILLAKVMSHITLIKREELMPYWDLAFNMMKKIDEEDAIFIAAAFALGENSIILSDDKHLKKQKSIQVITTKDFIKSNFLR
jgi:predicted nucleic acid-binding protein